MNPEARRDPAFIRAHLDKLRFFFEHYHHVDVTGLEHVPSGRALIVGNHNGGVMSPDMFALMVTWWQRFGVETEAYGLMHDLPFLVPVVGDWMARLGAVPAEPGNAKRLLERDAKVLVYPGGDLDAFRPWAQRHRIVFGARRGFVRTAISTGAPIVPVVAVGAHEGWFVVTDGRVLAQKLGLPRVRVQVLPIAVGLPWLLFVGTAPYLPVPLRMKIRVLPPIRFEVPPEAAHDDAVVDACRERVITCMQSALDDLASEGGYGPRLGGMTSVIGRARAAVYP